MKLSTKIFLGFAIVIVLSVMDSYVNGLLSKKVNINNAFLANSELIIRNAGRINQRITEMQSGFRGFLLTGDDDFLDAYKMGLNELPQFFKDERKLIASSVPQRNRLDSIYQLHMQWINYTDGLIKAKREGISKNSVSENYRMLFENQLRRQVGKKYNDKISEIFQDFNHFEYAKREERRKALLESIRKTEIYSNVFLILTIFIGLLCSLYIVRIISKRIALMVNVAENISKGEFAVVKDEQNDELTSLSHSLNIMSERLSKNIKELERRNSELNQFAYVVSHDLKAPIRGIYNVIQWIEEDLEKELSSQMREYLSIIPERIKRMEDLINGLLDYARISRQTPLKEQVDVNLLLKDLMVLIVPDKFTVTIGKMPVLYTERIRLEQVFSNLISNAVKYSKTEKGRLSIQCKELAKFYEFKVSDNGIGIHPEFHDRIFVIFQTLREKNEKESTGIGLAIVKKIIDDQHGTIRVNSEPGKGADFIFTWPKN